MDKLGIQPSILITQVINFAILAGLLWKFLYKPVTKMLDARKHQIESDLKLSQSLKEQQADLDSEKQKILKQAHLEASEIITSAKKTAKIQKDAELAATKVDIAKERTKLLKEIESTIAKERLAVNKSAMEIAATLTTKVLSESLSKTDQTKIIELALAKLAKTHAK